MAMILLLSSVVVQPVDGCALVGGSKEKKQLVAVFTDGRLLGTLGFIARIASR